MALKKIAVITYNVNDGLVHQRIHIPFHQLRHDFEFIFRSLPDVVHSDLFYVDAVVLVHPHSPDMLYLASRVKKHYGIPVIIDLDDLLQGISIDHPEFRLFQGNKVEQIIMQSDFAVYSTEYLHKNLCHLSRDGHSTVIENSINEEVYKNWKPNNKIHKNCFIAGWTGGQTHRADQYYTFLAGLEQFLFEKPDAKAYFHLLCPERLQARFGNQIIFEPNPCDFLDYPGFSATYPFDICMVGLTPHAFNEAKSDLKLLEMAPNKIPLIASPRSDFKQHSSKQMMLYAEDKHDTYLSWYDALTWAYDNPDELKLMGQRAYDYVMTERTSKRTSEKWKNVLNAVIEVSGSNGSATLG